jgi:LysM domain
MPDKGHAAQRRLRVFLGTVATALVVALALPWGGAGGRALATPGPARAGDPVSAHSIYIVQPGDTLWTIAERLDPGGDPRPLEVRMAAEVGGDTIVPGERLVLP